MKRLLKSNLLSYIFCFGILITVVYSVSLIQTQAATLNAIATSTKEACSSPKIYATNNETNYCNIPIINKTINRYVEKVSTAKTEIADSIRNLGAVKSIKDIFNQVNQSFIKLSAFQKNQAIVLAELFIILMAVQIYYKRHTIRALQRFNKLVVRPINIIKNKIHIFNLSILRLIQDDEIQEVNVNLKEFISEKAKLKFYNNKSLLMKLLVLRMSMQIKIIYIDSMLLSIAEQRKVNSRGCPLKPYNLVNSS